MWIGVSLIFAAATHLMIDDELYSNYLGLVGGFCIVSILFALYKYTNDVRIIVALLLQRIAMVMLDAVRMYFSLSAIGVFIEPLHSCLLVLVGIAGSVFTIVPAGLGVCEIITAALVPLIGVSAAAGFVSASLNRILDMSVIALAAHLLSSKYNQKNV